MKHVAATQDKQWKNTLSVAWPLALNALLMQAMLMIDTLLVAPLGEAPLAGMGIAGTIVAFIMGLQMALANGSQMLLSRAVGARRMDYLVKHWHAGTLINMMLAIPCCLGLWLFGHNIVALITPLEAVQEQAMAYMNIALLVLPINAITGVLTSLYNSHGLSRIPLQGYVYELPLNAGLSWILIFGIGPAPELGLAGGAIGTVVAIIFRIYFLVKRLDMMPLLEDRFCLNWPSLKGYIKPHFWEIFPVAANVGMLQTSIMVYQLLYAQLPLSQYAAITVLMPWIRMGSQAMTSWAQANAIVVSQTIGAEQMDRLPGLIKEGIWGSVLFSIATSFIFLGISFSFAWTYPELQQETLDALWQLTPLLVFLPLFRGYNTYHGHVLRALGDTTQVFKINFSGQWLFGIPLTAFVVFGWEASLFWAFAIQPLEEVVKAGPFTWQRMQAQKRLLAHGFATKLGPNAA